MSDRALMRREEAKFLKAAQRVLQQGGFPNPERTGCPDKSTLKAIAFREISPDQVMDWIDHLGFCSPCYKEYAVLRRQVLSRRWIRFAAIAACITVGLTIGIWLWIGGWRQHSVGGRGEIARREESGSYQPYLLDLRNRVVLRGEESIPDETPIELPRRRLSLSIYLPIGSEAGKYEFEFAQEPEKPLVRAEDVAGLRDGIAAFNVKVNLESLRPGPYLACIRRTGRSWRYYRVVLK